MSSAEQAVSQVQLADVDLTSLRWHSDGPPHELFARMRREAPCSPRAPSSRSSG